MDQKSIANFFDSKCFGTLLRKFKNIYREGVYRNFCVPRGYLQQIWSKGLKILTDLSPSLYHVNILGLLMNIAT